MGQDRLNALLLLYIHKVIILDYETVIDLYASHYPRWMVLVNPFVNINIDCSGISNCVGVVQAL